MRWAQAMEDASHADAGTQEQFARVCLALLDLAITATPSRDPMVLLTPLLHMLRSPQPATQYSALRERAPCPHTAAADERRAGTMPLLPPRQMPR